MQSRIPQNHDGITYSSFASFKLFIYRLNNIADYVANLVLFHHLWSQKCITSFLHSLVFVEMF